MNSEFASAELTIGQVNALVKRVGGHENVLRILRNEVGFSFVTLPPNPVDKIVLTVDYGTKEKPRTLEEMIVAGRYDWRNTDIIPKRFPIVGVGIVEFEAELVHPNRPISSDDAEALIKGDDPTNPWEPGKIEHLLSFGEKFPDEQRKYPIVALGSVGEVGGDRDVPCLSRLDSGRGLHLSWRCDDWVPFCRFLRVRRISAPRA